MAIIQISKIQQRSGNLVDLPLLDEAQLGWANDARRLFIGTTTPNPNENVEVLTSYSNITFSQLVGSEGNLNISSAQNGQLLAYVASTNTWDNAGGNSLQPGNSALYSNTSIHLGDVSTLNIGGGAIGYVLETDGLGNLSWTPKTTVTAYISDVTQDNPGIVTTTQDNFFTEGSEITITDVEGMTELNGNSYYVNVLTSNTFALYSDSGLSTPVDTTGFTEYTSNGRAISSVGGSGSAAAGGSNTTIQFNDNNVIQGNAGFTFNKTTGAVSIPGNVTAVNGNLGNLATANYFAGTLTTAAQPNITSLGTLSSVSVSGNANVGNLNTAGNVIASQVTANSNGTGNNFKVGDDAFIGDINITNTMVVKGQQDGTKGYIIFGNNDTTATLGRNGAGALTYNGSFSVVGNANIGNIGTGGLITATGNVSAGNLITGGVVSASGNASVLGIKTDNYYYANGVAISFAGSYSNSNVAAYLPTYTGNISAGNINLSNAAIVSANNMQLTTGANTNAGNITGNWTLTTGSKLSATYADLAEYYEADEHYEPGTVLAFGGEKEVTIAEDSTTRVAGVVSTNPAYAMNANCKGIAVAIALQGRVPTKVRGTVRKGDMMVSAGNGYARPWNTPQMGTVVGKALENFDGIEGVIEIAVGRL